MNHTKKANQVVQLLGNLIKISRKEKKLTLQELADQAQISRGLLQRVENGDNRCSIGSFMKLAVLLDVKLPDGAVPELSTYLQFTEEKLALLPKSIRKHY